MTSIDSLVQSETSKRNRELFLVRKFQENFKTALCGAIQNGSFQSHTKTKVLVFVCFDSFVIVLLMEMISILWMSTISLCHLTLKGGFHGLAHAQATTIIVALRTVSKNRLRHQRPPT